MKYMPYVLIASVFIILAMTGCLAPSSESNQIQSANHKRAIVYKDAVCPKCDGVGTHEASTGEKIGLAITTFGFGLLIDETECEKCKGTGVVRIPVISD